MSGRAPIQKYNTYENRQAQTANGSAYKIGEYCGKNLWWMVLVGLLCVLVYMFYAGWSDCESSKATVGGVVMHYGCRKSGGCGKQCPYMNTNDPRMALVLHRNIIKEITDKIEHVYGQTMVLIANTFDDTPPEQQEGLDVAIEAPAKTLQLCLDKVFPLLTKTEDLVIAFSKSKSTSSEVYAAQNRGAALEAAAIINLRIFSIANMKIGAIVKNSRMTNLSTQAKIKVNKFDEEYAKAFVAKTSVDESYMKAVALNASVDTKELKTANYAELVKAIMSADTSFHDIVLIMARLISTAQDANALEQTAASQYKIIADLMARVESFEGFSNSMPGEVPSDEVSSLIINNDYSTALIRTALEPEIVQNHRKFANERATFDSGGGVPAVPDHDSDINPWVGLFGRPTYRRTDGTSADTGGHPLRQIPSNHPDNLMREHTPRLTIG